MVPTILDSEASQRFSARPDFPEETPEGIIISKLESSQYLN